MPRSRWMRGLRAAARPLGWAVRAGAAWLGLLAAAAPAQAQTQPIGPLNEVPFVTTPDRVTLAMLELAGVNAQDRVLDLGSGDGRIVITAARRFGAQGLGVEIDPQLVERSRANAQAAGVADRARFVEQDLFKTDFSQASVITMYLLPDVNLALRPRLLALKPGTRVVSHDWDMGDWLPDRSLTLQVPEKTIGREKISRVHLWVVPAEVAGRWCGSGGRTLQITQQFQRVDARVGTPGAATAASGQLHGAMLKLAQGTLQMTLEAGADGAMQVHDAQGAWAIDWSGQRLRRASPSGDCPGV